MFKTQVNFCESYFWFAFTPWSFQDTHFTLEPRTDRNEFKVLMQKVRFRTLKFILNENGKNWIKINKLIKLKHSCEKLFNSTNLVLVYT